MEWAILARSPGLQLVPAEPSRHGGLLRGSREVGMHPAFQTSDRHVPQHLPCPSLKDGPVGT